MVLTSRVIELREWDKRDGIMIYGSFCMLQHLKWWFKPEQMIWQGPGVVQGGAKIRQNQSKSMVLTRLKIRIGEGVKRNGIIIYWHRDSLTERHIDECKVCCNDTWTYQHKDGQTSHRRIINHYNQHFVFFFAYPIALWSLIATKQRLIESCRFHHRLAFLK